MAAASPAIRRVDCRFRSAPTALQEACRPPGISKMPIPMMISISRNTKMKGVTSEFNCSTTQIPSALNLKGAAHSLLSPPDLRFLPNALRRYGIFPEYRTCRANDHPQKPAPPAVQLGDFDTIRAMTAANMVGAMNHKALITSGDERNVAKKSCQKLYGSITSPH